MMCDSVVTNGPISLPPTTTAQLSIGPSATFPGGVESVANRGHSVASIPSILRMPRKTGAGWRYSPAESVYARPGAHRGRRSCGPIIKSANRLPAARAIRRVRGEVGWALPGQCPGRRGGSTAWSVRQRTRVRAAEATDSCPIAPSTVGGLPAHSASLGTSCIGCPKNCAELNGSLVFLSTVCASVI
jgi:hypothetical protein